MSAPHQLLDYIQKRYFDKNYRALIWSGSFSDYLEIVKKKPQVFRQWQGCYFWSGCLFDEVNEFHQISRTLLRDGTKGSFVTRPRR